MKKVVGSETNKKELICIKMRTNMEDRNEGPASMKRHFTLKRLGDEQIEMEPTSVRPDATAGQEKGGRPDRTPAEQCAPRRQGRRQARLADSSGPLALSRGHRGKADKPLLQPSGHRLPKRDRKAEALMSRVPGV